MKLKSLLLSLFVLAGMTAFSQALTFKVQTVKYSTSTRILAIWITDANNKFVKTVYASSKHSYSGDLVKWVASSAKNVVDATTAASSAHPSTPATYTWNCTNVSKVVVPDGNYFVNVEFTEEPLATNTKYTQCPFTIGVAGSGSIADATYFKGVSWSTTQSAQTPIVEIQVSSKYTVYYKPNTKMLQVNFDPQLHGKAMLNIVDLKGRVVVKQSLNAEVSNINTAQLAKGAYIVKLTDSKGNAQTQKIVVR